MHVLSVFVLFSFGVMGLTMLGDHYFHHAGDHWTFMAYVLGVGLAWLAAFNMWSLWHVGMRADWVGTTLTGFALGGSATFLHTVTGFFSGLHHKFEDQAKVMEEHELRRAA